MIERDYFYMSPLFIWENSSQFAFNWQKVKDMRTYATSELENSRSDLCEAVNQSVTREDPPGWSPDLDCSILSPLHASDSISFLSACDSSVGRGLGGSGGDNQCRIVKKKTNPWRGLLAQAKTSVSCKHRARSCSIAEGFQLCPPCPHMDRPSAAIVSNT